MSQCWLWAERQREKLGMPSYGSESLERKGERERKREIATEREREREKRQRKRQRATGLPGRGCRGLPGRGTRRGSRPAQCAMLRAGPEREASGTG